jgi:hypothetical protein
MCQDPNLLTAARRIPPHGALLVRMTFIFHEFWGDVCLEYSDFNSRSNCHNLPRLGVYLRTTCAALWPCPDLLHDQYHGPRCAKGRLGHSTHQQVLRATRTATNSHLQQRRQQAGPWTRLARPTAGLRVLPDVHQEGPAEPSATTTSGQERQWLVRRGENGSREECRKQTAPSDVYSPSKQCKFCGPEAVLVAWGVMRVR